MPGGFAFSPAGSPFWIADNAPGCSTLYDGTGAKVSLEVKLPLPGNVVPKTDCKTVKPPPVPPPNPTPAAPTGIIWNPSPAFVVPGTVSTANPNGIPAVFIFDTENGTISAWARGLSPPDHAVIAVDNSKSPSPANGAVYRTIDVFGPPNKPGDPFTPEMTSGFKDSQIPAGYAPFGIQNIDGDLFVTYAKQNAEKHDDEAGPGHGFVDVFDTGGHLLRRFASRGPLNSPWGVTRASFAFGVFSGDILVGNFGDGKINVFDSQGRFIDELEGTNGKPVVIDGLWTLTLGGVARSSSDMTRSILRPVPTERPMAYSGRSLPCQTTDG